MKNANGKDSVSFNYIIESTDFEWMKGNYGRFAKAYNKMKDMGVDVFACITNSCSCREDPCVQFRVVGDKRTLERALDYFFGSECGLPSVVLKPSKSYGVSEDGYKIAEKVVNRHGKRLKSTFKGFFLEKVVD